MTSEATRLGDGKKIVRGWRFVVPSQTLFSGCLYESIGDVSPVVGMHPV